jgi:DNA-binding NarL/FixJ family response regulator
MTKIRVVVVDDHAILREGVVALIGTQADMEVVGEAGDGLSAVEVARRTAPDVAVVDLSMPGRGGIDLIRRLGEVVPRTRCLVLSMHEDAAYLRSALDARATGYVAKRAAGSKLLDGIRATARGEAYVSLPAEVLARTFRASGRTGGGDGARLTDRERQVLVLIADGFTNKEIGAQLSISKKSVDSYRARIYEKLGVRSRAEIVRFATDAGLLSRPPSA